MRVSIDSGAAADSASDEPGLTVAAVARRMGVAPATLRTWDRRYGIGPGHHRPGAHRRYGAADLARLEHMRRLVIAGIPPAQAAQAARDLTIDDAALAPVTQLPAPVAPADGDPGPAARPGGGRVVPMPGGGPAVRGLARAAQSIDSAACLAILSDTLERRGAVWTWDNLIVPVLVGIGEQWSASGRGIEIEHSFSASVQDALSGSVRAAAPGVNSRSVVLACAPGEMHSLVLWAVAAALAERRVSARILGASLPETALASAVERLGPAAVFVWSQLPDSADPQMLSGIPHFRPAASVLIGGPGWLADPPAGVVRVTDLADTVARITHAVGG